MNNSQAEINPVTGDKILKYTLDNGISMYLCKKEGFKSTIGMFGTEYGSIDNEFSDISTGEKVKVPEGIAHFLEHKLFEQEGGNALDLFAKMGVSSNAYTTFDHTTYYFETTKKVNESIEKLVELVTGPYFTVENVEKEKGIIMQELKMYEDDPGSVVYYNTLKAMYINHPLNIDIVGTRDSLGRITRENLYTCYNTFYSPKNMFFIVIGDVDEEKTAEYVNSLFNNKERTEKSKEIIRYRNDEPEGINSAIIQKDLEIYMPYISFGFKLKPRSGIENKKSDIITQIIDEACFSEMSDFYENMYNSGILNDTIQFEYGYGNDYSYLVLLGCSKKIEEYIEKVKSRLKELKENGINNQAFETAKKKLLGKQIGKSEEPMEMTRQIINSYISKTDIFDDITILKNITKEDVNKFLREELDENKMVKSTVISK